MIFIGEKISMKHVLVLEPSLRSFCWELKKLIKDGYTQVVGSNNVKSVITGVPISTQAIDFNDVNTIFTVALVNDQGTYTIIVEKNSDDFYTVVTQLLTNNYQIVTGSLNLNTEKLSGFDVKISRCYTTWYSCTMCK